MEYQDSIRTFTNVQAYLAFLLVEAAPDSVLTAAWERFYGFYDGLIRRVCRSRGLAGHEVEDCAQEVWRQLVVSLQDFQFDPNRSGLRGWICTLIRNKAIDHLRARGRRKELSYDESLHNDCVATIPSGGDPLDALWDHELLAAAVEELKCQTGEVNFEIFCRRILEGQSVNEVAATFDLTPQQVWYRLHRTSKKMRAIWNLYAGAPLEACDGRWKGSKELDVAVGRAGAAGGDVGDVGNASTG